MKKREINELVEKSTNGQSALQNEEAPRKQG